MRCPFLLHIVIQRLHRAARVVLPVVVLLVVLLVVVFGLLWLDDDVPWNGADNFIRFNDIIGKDPPGTIVVVPAPPKLDLFIDVATLGRPDPVDEFLTETVLQCVEILCPIGSDVLISGIVVACFYTTSGAIRCRVCHCRKKRKGNKHDDDGNTKTNTLYWLATRPGADGIQTEPVDAQVTFSVDMSNTALVNGSVYITGNGLDSWCGTCIAMSDEDGDGVFTKTMSLPSGAVEYKFLNGGWDGAESFDPAIHGACTLTTGEFTNRLVTVPEGVASLAVPVVCFNSCEPCSGQPCASDTNGNGICDEDDIAGCTYTWSANFDPLATMDDGSCEDPGGTNASCVADLTEDGVVTISDLLLVLAAFGEVCE